MTSGTAVTWELAELQALRRGPDLQDRSLHLGRRLCDWSAHSILRNKGTGLSEILLLTYKTRINTVFYFMRINGRIRAQGARDRGLIPVLPHGDGRYALKAKCDKSVKTAFVYCEESCIFCCYHVMYRE